MALVARPSFLFLLSGSASLELGSSIWFSPLFSASFWNTVPLLTLALSALLFFPLFFSLSLQCLASL